MIQIVVGDLHLQPSNLNIASKLFDEIEKVIENYNHNDQIQLIFLGDIYHTKDILRSQCQNFFISRLLRIRGYVNKVIILVGNHDYENLNCENHSLQPLKNLDNIWIVDHPWYDASTKSLFLPFYPSNEKFLLALTSIPVANGTNLFCHQGFLGADFGNGVKDCDSLSVDCVPSTYKQIFAGHYHKPHRVNQRLIYVGTPFTHSFGEANQNKFLMIVGDNSVSEFYTYPLYLSSHIRFHWNETVNKFIVSPDDGWKYQNEDQVELIITCSKQNINEYNSKWVLDKIGVPFERIKVKFEFVDANKPVRLSDKISHEEMLTQFLKMKEWNIEKEAMEILSESKM